MLSGMGGIGRNWGEPAGDEALTRPFRADLVSGFAVGVRFRSSMHSASVLPGLEHQTGQNRRASKGGGTRNLY